MSPTRRDFLVSTAAATLGAAIGSPQIARALQQGRAPGQAVPPTQGPGVPPAQGQAQPVFTPIRRDVGTFTMRGGTVGWLVNAGGVAVVDTQFPAEARALVNGLQARSSGRGVEVLLNTHHHGDHTGGNPAFRGIARRVVAHSMADIHMRRLPGTEPGAAPQPNAAEPLYPDTTFTHMWTTTVGDERIIARHHGRAHTSGDATITFERANVVHMGDLMFHQRHPVVDRAAGASLRNWMRVLDATVQAHDADTIYIFGHANTGLPVTGNAADLLRFRDYIGALLAFVERGIGAGRSREEVLALREPLAGFEAWGRFGQPGARDPLTVAYEELSTGG